MYSHPDDFLPFLPSAEGEDGQGAGDAGMMSPKEFEGYCKAIKDTGVWGGEPEILALTRAFNVPIHVIQGGVPPVVIHNPSNPSDQDIHNKQAARISYHRRMYGLGEVRHWCDRLLRILYVPALQLPSTQRRTVPGHKRYS